MLGITATPVRDVDGRDMAEENVADTHPITIKKQNIFVKIFRKIKALFK